jgi:adenosylcobinamide kinase/adenosylcobinamide-phosphate guanylyltransferase
MSKIILITGPARSGKSNFALSLAKKFPSPSYVFIATCQAKDPEMAQRIKTHKVKRDRTFRTIEEPKELETVLEGLKGKESTVIVDCLTLWISNLLLEGCSQSSILKKLKSIVKISRDIKGTVIFVTNEVGAGIVPANELSRNFRDVAGQISQIVAQSADEVYLSVAGIPLKIKPSSLKEGI